MLDVTESQERGSVTGRVTVGIGNGVVRLGVERMLQLMPREPEISTRSGLAGALDSGLHAGDVLIALLNEVDEDSANELRDTVARGVGIVLLVEEGDLFDLPKVMGLRAGFVRASSVNEYSLRKAVAAAANGGAAIPEELASDLVRFAGRHKAPPQVRLRLTPREQEALVLMVEGMSNKQIARGLQISQNGAKRLVANILAKMDCNNRTLAVSRALREGLYERYAHARQAAP
ncbi:helix-turn-helix transcriptional regulator [Streptomyces millisiae]|uniref:LuxR C-terminal-related transcriptional regulator n=1 Tax=Streptomyces millisiae TaxID=3075542 RepID=A0ABU2LT64_9ACTN|nr:LuxR C-terminal-related transcriptional regulator [Streptomyces sp. DSM 44918]MDT0320784.1 LuxR C-terminal-related transcriptional regulator [Streptomyces sp. DSM 44918]